MPLQASQTAVIKSGGRNDAEMLFDPEYQALRAAILSLARDGHRLIDHSAAGTTVSPTRAPWAWCSSGSTSSIGSLPTARLHAREADRRISSKCLLLDRAGCRN